MRGILLSTGLLWLLSACGLATSVEEERQAIAAVVQSRYATDGTASIDPIVLRGDYAVAGWTRDDAGGRALLHKDGGSWAIVVNAGEELRDAEFLQDAGMAEAEAKALVNMVIATERKVPEQRLAMFDRAQISR